MRNALGCGVAAGILFAATAAMAQEPAAVQADPPPVKATVTATTTQTTTATHTEPVVVVTDAKKDDTHGRDLTDHERVIGHFGVGYFGVTAQPIGTGVAGSVGKATVQVPVIGMRYWLMERIGIDAGLGLNFFSSGNSTTSGTTTKDTDGPAVAAFALHGGVPIAFAYGKHYKFLAIPEVNFGYATQVEQGQGTAAQNANTPDVHRTGIRFDVGARIGTEIQFGFIGIPELALQASVGLNFQHSSWSASQPTKGTGLAASSSQTSTEFGTTVQSDPWAIFTNNIAAIYYFP